MEYEWLFKISGYLLLFLFMYVYDRPSNYLAVLSYLLVGVYLSSLIPISLIDKILVLYCGLHLTHSELVRCRLFLGVYICLFWYYPIAIIYNMFYKDKDNDK